MSKETKSWRLDSEQGLKKEDLKALSGTAEGQEQLWGLKVKLDECLEWCDRHPEDEGASVAAAAAAADEGGDEGDDEASKEKHEEFATALEAMAARAEELRKTGAKAERVIQYTDDATPQSLLEWCKSLPDVTPTLGYEVRNVANLASTIRRVVG
eukprot:Hpha_TRINITY_DN16710_c6_g1::TRINITY_DN16710_c6_g1_i1::g.77996::m.77996